jgi:hypothetical protein
MLLQGRRRFCCWLQRLQPQHVLLLLCHNLLLQPCCGNRKWLRWHQAWQLLLSA